MKKFDPSLVRLARYALDYKMQLFWAAVWMVGVASMSSLTATLLGQLTDRGFYDKDPAAVIMAPVALIGVTLLFAVSTVMSKYILTNVSQSIMVTLRTQMFGNMLDWPLEGYGKYDSGLVTSKFVNEANVAISGAVESATILVRDSMQVIALFAILLWQDWQLTLVTCAVGPVAGWLLRIIRKKIKGTVKKSQEAIADVISCVQESYEAERLIKVSGTYGYEEQRFGRINDEIRRTTLRRIRLQGMGTPVTQVVTMAGVAIVVGFALFQAQQGLLSLGEFITFLSAMLLMMPPIQHLAGLNATFTSIAVAAQSVFEMIDAPKQKDEGTGTLENVRGEVRFVNVKVRYPEAHDDAVKCFNAVIRPGEHVAIVGHSGSGKTTTVNLLPRFVEITSGRISIDGTDIGTCTLRSLRDSMSVVSQNVVLFDTTIRENIAYGCPGATPEQIDAAVKAAALEDFVATLPQGLETRVGEGGKLLSGGQKQRVSIARAILKNAPILILDEATSALDSESELKIKEALEVLMKDRTCLMVAHRFSTIENADRIIVMDRGEVIEEGTPAELLALNGAYARLKALQSGKSE